MFLHVAFAKRVEHAHWFETLILVGMVIQAFGTSQFQAHFELHYHTFPLNFIMALQDSDSDAPIEGHGLS